MVAATLASVALAGTPDGTRLRPGVACFVIERDGKAIGETYQAIKLDRLDGRKVWDVVVHQRVAAAGFDMRDHFILAYGDLAPLRFDSQRATKTSERGWQRVSLRYTPSRILGSKTTRDKTTPIDVALDHGVVDGNLWGITFAALDLRQGAVFHLPSWQYDQGFGEFVVRVVGSERKATPAGAVDSWVLEAGTDPKRMSRYFIAKRGPREIGYQAGPMVQRLGGRCANLN